MLVLLITLGLATGGLSALLCPTKVDYTVTVHLPHPTSCSKFLTCVGNNPVEQDCPGGLQWNERLSLCDYPQGALCSRGELSKNEQSFNSTAVSASVCLPTTRCPLNSNPTEQVVFLKHSDCSKFYACVSTQAVELSCPKGLYWNSQDCVCDYDVDVECVEGGTRREEEPDVEPELNPEEQPEEEPKEEPQEEPKNESEIEPQQEPEVDPEQVPMEEPSVVRRRRAAEEGSTTAEPASSAATAAATTAAPAATSAPAVTSAPSGPTTSRAPIESGAVTHAVSCFAVIVATITMSVL